MCLRSLIRLTFVSRQDLPLFSRLRSQARLQPFAMQGKIEASHRGFDLAGGIAHSNANCGQRDLPRIRPTTLLAVALFSRLPRTFLVHWLTEFECCVNSAHEPNAC